MKRTVGAHGHGSGLLLLGQGILGVDIRQARALDHVERRESPTRLVEKVVTGLVGFVYGALIGSLGTSGIETGHWLVAHQAVFFLGLIAWGLLGSARLADSVPFHRTRALPLANSTWLASRILSLGRRGLLPLLSYLGASLTIAAITGIPLLVLAFSILGAALQVVLVVAWLYVATCVLWRWGGLGTVRWLAGAAMTLLVATWLAGVVGREQGLDPWRLVVGLREWTLPWMVGEIWSWWQGRADAVTPRRLTTLTAVSLVLVRVLGQLLDSGVIRHAARARSPHPGRAITGGARRSLGRVLVPDPGERAVFDWAARLILRPSEVRGAVVGILFVFSVCCPLVFAKQWEGWHPLVVLFPGAQLLAAVVCLLSSREAHEAEARWIVEVHGVSSVEGIRLSALSGVFVACFLPAVLLAGCAWMIAARATPLESLTLTLLSTVSAAALLRFGPFKTPYVERGGDRLHERMALMAALALTSSVAGAVALGVELLAPPPWFHTVLAALSVAVGIVLLRSRPVSRGSPD